MESTSLDDVLYRYASFRNLVDPITHDLIISLARYVHCPKTVQHHINPPDPNSYVKLHISPKYPHSHMKQMNQFNVKNDKYCRLE